MKSSATALPRRMLFLHGMFLPPSVYQDSLAAPLFSCLKDHGWECVFLKSPRPISGPVFDAVLKRFPDLKENPEWVNSRNDDEVEGSTKVFDGLQGSLLVIQEYLDEQPPFDVIAGHSQGAMMASILSLLAEQQKDSDKKDDDKLTFKVSQEKRWKAILCMNAPNSYETERHLRNVEATAVAVPSIHVFGGESDMTWKGQQAMQRVHHPQEFHIIHHDAGHFFSSDKDHLEEIAQALDKLVPKK